MSHVPTLFTNILHLIAWGNISKAASRLYHIDLGMTVRSHLRVELIRDLSSLGGALDW